MRKYSLTILVAFALTAITALFTLPATATIHSNVPSDVQNFAQTDGITQARQELGIDPKGVGLTADETSHLTVGPGLQVNAIDYTKLKSGDDNSLISLIHPLDEWQFLLEVNGQPKSLMTIAKVGGKLHVMKMGGGGLDGLVAAWNLFDKTSQSQVEPVLIEYREVEFLAGTFNEQELAISNATGVLAQSIDNLDDTKMRPSADFVKVLREQANQKGDPALVAGMTAATVHSPTGPSAWVIVTVSVLLGILLLVIIASANRKR